MSLSLYQYEKQYKRRELSNYGSSMTTGLIGSYHYGNIVSGFNSQYSQIINGLRQERTDVAERLSAKLADNPNFTGMRSDGVNLAWKYEKADVEMGGKGSARWTKKERQQILDKGKVRKAEGHHGKNVADHPEEQADPDNIHFYKSRQEHLKQGHNGDFRNSSDMKEIDKDKMLARTNARRVVLKEVTGILVTASIAFGISASIETISILAREGITPYSVKYALKQGAKTGIKSAGIALGVYGVSRLLKSILQKVTPMCEKWVNATNQLIISAVMAGVEFYVMKKNGYSTKEALKKVGFNLAIRLMILALQFIPGCGTALSIAANVIYSGVVLGMDIKGQRFNKKLEYKTVEWSMPHFA